MRVPDGTVLVKGDLELKPSSMKKYGSNICVMGDVTIKDAESFSQLNYLFAYGTVRVDKPLEEAFHYVDCVCDKIVIIGPGKYCIFDRPSVKIEKFILQKYPAGVHVEDCAEVELSEDLTPDEIIENLRISGCAIVCCSAGQEDAVNIVSKDAAEIEVAGTEGERGKKRKGEILSGTAEEKDAQVIHAAQYKM